MGDDTTEKSMTTHRMLKRLFIAIGLSAVCGQGWAQDAFMGEYEGTCHADQSQTTKATAKVIAEGPDYYRVVVMAEPLAPGEPTAQFEIYGVRQGDQVNLFGRANAEMWHGTIAGDRLVADPGYYGLSLELKKITANVPHRRRPTAGRCRGLVAVCARQGTGPFGVERKPVETPGRRQPAMQSRQGFDHHQASFGDMKLHVEFWLPLMAEHFGQERANSGVFLNNLYEIQVLDSFGLVPTMGDCAAIYSQTRPRVNANLPPEHWQTYDITLPAPRMNPDGSVKEKARVTVEFNGIKVQDNTSSRAAPLATNPASRRRTPPPGRCSCRTTATWPVSATSGWSNSSKAKSTGTLAIL